MKPSRQIKIAGAAICLYAAWNARDLVAAWRHSPYDRFGWLAFLLWSFPAALAAARRADASAAWFGAGLAVSLAGEVVDLNIVKHAGLAIAIAGFFKTRAATLVWLACALGWMPALGWALNASGAVAVNALRILAAIVPAIFLRRRLL